MRSNALGSEHDSCERECIGKVHSGLHDNRTGIDMCSWAQRSFHGRNVLVKFSLDRLSSRENGTKLQSLWDIPKLSLELGENVESLLKRSCVREGNRLGLSFRGRISGVTRKSQRRSRLLEY